MAERVVGRSGRSRTGVWWLGRTPLKFNCGSPTHLCPVRLLTSLSDFALRARLRAHSLRLDYPGSFFLPAFVSLPHFTTRSFLSLCLELLFPLAERTQQRTPVGKMNTEGVRRLGDERQGTRGAAARHRQTPTDTETRRQPERPAEEERERKPASQVRLVFFFIFFLLLSLQRRKSSI